MDLLLDSRMNTTPKESRKQAQVKEAGFSPPCWPITKLCVTGSNGTDHVNEGLSGTEISNQGLKPRRGFKSLPYLWMPEFILGCAGRRARVPSAPLAELGFTVNLLVGSFIPQRTHQDLRHHVVFISIVILRTEGTQIPLLQQPIGSYNTKTQHRLANNPMSLTIPPTPMGFPSSGY